MTVGSARDSAGAEASIFAEKIYVACNIESGRNLRSRPRAVEAL